MKHLKLYEDYTDDEIGDLIDDLSKVGAAESPIKIESRYSGKVHRINPRLLHPVIQKLGKILNMSPGEIESAKEKEEVGRLLIQISKHLKGYGTLQGSPINIVEE